MPTELTWSIAAILIADGFLLGVGWIIAEAIYSFVIGVLSRSRQGG